MAKLCRDKHVFVGALAALGQPLDVRIDGELVRFGNPPLDEAERALHDGLPRVAAGNRSAVVARETAGLR
jgi:hypothetical protein